jgi:hypothetical protein
MQLHNNTKPNQETASAVINDTQKADGWINPPDYSNEEKLQMDALMMRLHQAQMDRDKSHPEFNNQTYIQNYENNERIANTFVAGKKFEGDIQIASGTVEQKMFAVLAEINRLALTPQVLAFNEESEELVSLGHAMTDVLFETSKREDPMDEKRLVRQLELLKQGHVFVQELWTKRWKTVKKGVDKSQIGKFKGVDWTSQLELAWSGPERQILYGPGVFIGNIREPDMKKQPFIYTHKITSYSEAKSRYGQKNPDGTDVWERWQYVQKVRRQNIVSTTTIDNSMNNAWTLTQVGLDEVEEVHYQDKFNNEYQIFLNGVPMLPIGFPLSVISPGGEYNIEKQIFQYINPFFAYGRSFVARVKEQSDILDELLKLLIIKTRKSIHPPYANSSGRVISSRVLMPGRITMGIDASSLQAIGQEGQGVISSEFQMYKLLQDNIDENTVSKQFTGSQGKAGQTATETNILQSQAQKVLSLTIFSATMLEGKLGYLRLWNVLENYFEPLDTRYNRASQKIEEVFRVTTRRNVKLDDGDDGFGIRQTVPTAGELPDSESVREQELFTDVPEPPEGVKKKTRQQLGLPPIKVIYLNPERLKAAKLYWYIDVDTKEKETSNVEKLMFREELADIAMLMRMGSVPNLEALESSHALIWNRPKDKMFKSVPEPSAIAGGAQAMGGGAPEVEPPISNPPAGVGLPA